MNGLLDILNRTLQNVLDLPVLRHPLEWFDTVWRHFLRLGEDEQAFAIISIAILLFTLLSILFALRAVLIHLSRQRTQYRLERLQEEWTQNLLDVLYGDVGVKVLWRKVRPRDRLYYIDFLAAYARRVTGKERTQIEASARPYLRLIRRRTRSSDPARRARALRTLADLTPQRSPKLLVKALDDPSDLVSMVAARTLIRIGDSSHLPLILNRINRYEIWSEWYAASMLASAGSGATFYLRVFLNQKLANPRTQAIVLRALGMIGDSGALPHAEAALQSATNKSLQIIALDLIGELGSGDQAQPVRKAVEQGDDDVRAHALRALGQVGDSSDVPLLVKHLSHPSPWVALRAASSLVKLGAHAALENFIESGTPNAVYAQQALAEEVYG